MKHSTLLAAAWLSLQPLTAQACPFCGSTRGEQVRAAIFNSEFFYNLGVLLLPFSVLLVIIAAVYFGAAEGEPWERPSHE